MNHPLRVSGTYTVCELHSETNDLFFRQRSLLQRLPQRCTGNQFHYQEIQAVPGAEFVYDLNVRMIHLGKSQGFFAKIPACNVIGKSAFGQDL